MSEGNDNSNSAVELETKSVENTNKSTPKKSPHAWSARRKKKKRKRRSALFTKKKVRTTTSNLRIPKQQRRKLYRDRCKQKKILISKGLIDQKENMPPINHENVRANYPIDIDSNTQDTNTNSKAKAKPKPKPKQKKKNKKKKKTAIDTTNAHYNLRSRKRQRNSDENVLISMENIPMFKLERNENISNTNTNNRNGIKMENVKREMILPNVNEMNIPTLGHNTNTETKAIKNDLNEPRAKRIKLDRQRMDSNANISTLGVMGQSNIDWNLLLSQLNQNNNGQSNISHNMPINININTNQSINPVQNQYICNGFPPLNIPQLPLPYCIPNPIHNQNSNNIVAIPLPNIVNNIVTNNSNNNFVPSMDIFKEIENLSNSINTYQQFQNQTSNATNALEMLANVAMSMQDSNNNTSNNLQ